MYVGRYDDIAKLNNLQQALESQTCHLAHHQEITKLKHEAGLGKYSLALEQSL